jgi:hypothetical protein
MLPLADRATEAMCQEATPSPHRSRELEDCADEFFDRLLGFLARDRVVADMHAVNDASVYIGEWLLADEIRG